MSQTDATPFYLRTMAALNMVIYQAHGLHEGVWGGGANKRPTALFEIFAESGRFGRVTRDCRIHPGGLWFGPKLAEIRIEIVELGEKLEGTVRIIDRREDLAAMPNNPGVENETFNIWITKLCNFLKIKIGKGRAEVITLP